jgi:hypothetical protein
MSRSNVISRLGSDFSDEDLDMDVYESFNSMSAPGADALKKLAAQSAEESEYPDDELVNQEDPYLQGLLGPLGDD